MLSSLSRIHTRLRGRFALGALIALTGCATVQPHDDYQRAHRSLEERVQSGHAYDPESDALIDERVAQLLRDGLTIDEVVQIALLNNRGFQALFATIGASRADVVQSRLLTNPSISFLARFPEGGGRSSLNLSFGQELVDLWQIPVRAQVAEAQLEQTVLRVVTRGIDLAADAKKKFHWLAALNRLERITKENLELVGKSIQIAEARLKAGETGKVDVNLLRAAELEVKTMLLGLARDRNTARADLARALGLSRWKQPWELDESSDRSVVTLPDDPTLIISAMEERLEARIAEQRVRGLESELRRQYLNIVPSVQAGFEGERLERRSLPGRNILADTARASLRNGAPTAPDIQTRGERNIERRQIIDSLLGPSLQLTLPIWDQNQAQIAKAQYRVEQSRKEFEDLLDEVSREVQSAAAVARAAAALIDFFEKQGLPLATENLELARKAYQGGEQNIVAVIDAQRFLIAQRLAAVSADRDHQVAMAELQRALGGRWPPSISMQTTTAPASEKGPP